MWSVSGNCPQQGGGPVLWWRVHIMLPLHMCRNVEWTMRYFVTTMIDITCCNGYAITARSKIRKPLKVKCYHMGQDGRLKKSEYLDSAYQKTAKWKKYKCKSQEEKLKKKLIAEVTRLIRLFNSSKRWESVAIHMRQVLLPLILQKPSLK